MRASVTLVVRSAGAAGQIVSAYDTTPVIYFSGGSQMDLLGTVNTTIAQTLKATVQWSGTNAANEAKLLSARLERLA